VILKIWARTTVNISSQTSFLTDLKPRPLVLLTPSSLLNSSICSCGGLNQTSINFSGPSKPSKETCWSGLASTGV